MIIYGDINSNTLINFRSSELPCNCVQDKTSKKSGLITCWDDMAQLLTDCTVIPIGKNELIPTDSFLPANFWDSTTEVDIPQSVLEELDFWASCPPGTTHVKLVNTQVLVVLAKKILIVTCLRSHYYIHVLSRYNKVIEVLILIHVLPRVPKFKIKTNNVKGEHQPIAFVTLVTHTRVTNSRNG